MALLTLQSVSLAYGHVPLLDHVDLNIDAGDKIALIGRNGTGKSSLLKILADQARPDDGSVWRKPALRLAYVPQEPLLEAGKTVFEVAAEGLGDAQQLLSEYESVVHALESNQDATLLTRLEKLGSELDATDGWQLKSRIDNV